MNTYRGYEPQAESRGDPLSGMDSTVNPHGIFGPLFFPRNLHRENQKTVIRRFRIITSIYIVLLLNPFSKSMKYALFSACL